MTEFSRPLARGIIACDLRPEDQLVGVAITDGDREIMLFSSAGKAVRFHEADVRPMGRTACGVRGIQLDEGQRVIGLIIVAPGMALMVTENGFGKRTSLEEFPTKGRGGKGMISIVTSERNGAQIGAVLVQDGDEVMLITTGGVLVRTPVNDVRVVGRATQGVKMISLSGDEAAGIRGWKGWTAGKLGTPKTGGAGTRAAHGRGPVSISHWTRR